MSARIIAPRKGLDKLDFWIPNQSKYMDGDGEERRVQQVTPVHTYHDEEWPFIDGVELSFWMVACLFV